MKPISVSRVITFVIAFLFCTFSQGQTIGISSSAVWISDCNQDNYFNTSGLIGPASNTFANTNFGIHTRNSGTLILRGSELRTFKTSSTSNVCSAHLYYRIYPLSGTPSAFNSMDLSFADDCNISTNQFPSGGSCAAGDQKWNLVLPDGITIPYSPVDLTTFPAGNYVLEVYYDITGSSTNSSLCDETIVLNNGGANFRASFSIQAPSVASANPTSCNGSEGFITISGLAPGVTYSVSYSDDGNPVGPANMIADGAGQLIISALNAGLYSDFELAISGCTTNLNTGVILSNPVLVPKFNKISAFCAGTTAPVLPSTSLNGLTGTWSPSVVNNTTSGTYTFTPNPNQCGIPATINVTVTPRTTPAFTFGTSLTICSGGSVPSLPSTSINGVTGTWSPAVVSNTNSSTYTFTPSGSQCANGTTFTVTVNPNITPMFSFGTSLAICAGTGIPALPATSNNGITGSWSPSIVDNQISATYTFTPTTGQCATTTSFNVTVNPIVTPVFSFGSSLSICAGGTVPTLPTNSSNGVAGSWTPSVADNQNTATYTFTPTGGQCATSTSFTINVSPNVTPAFSFGTALSICSGGSVPILPSTSTNGVTGTWSPATVDNQNSATYTFMPDVGQCAIASSFTVTIKPILTPVFSFGTSMAICAGGSVPLLSTTSLNGITGTWNISAIDNQNSNTYTFSPDPGQCANSTTLTVTVNPVVIPVFSFGSSLTICAGASAPTLPATSNNGVTGTWSPSIVNTQNSNTYTFTPTAGQCATTLTFSVTVNPIVTPIFNFGTSLSICEGATVPALPNTSLNGVTGTWSSTVVDNHNSGSYTFTPNAGQCASPATLAVTVSPIVASTFSFGSSLTICAGSSVPPLPTISSNGISGTWSPATIDNQASRTYTFTPATGQCALSASLAVTVNQNTVPTFSFGTSLVICAGGTVPALPTTSSNGINGSWNPATTSNQSSAVYTFTPDVVPGQCLSSTSFTVTVNQNVTPVFSFGASLTVCAGSPAPVLPATSNNGVNGTWTPSVINNQTSGSYTFTPNAGQCVNSNFVLSVNVTPVGSVDFESDTTVTDGTLIPGNILSGTPLGVGFSWSNSNTGIGLSATGSGNVPSFTANNKGNSPIKGTITVIPSFNGCTGTAKNYVITVIPLAKDIFIPNVFSPNGDGNNDFLYAYSNYINKLEMRIFNQWGQQVQLITDPHKGWDGKYKGTPQPVGVYMYTLKAVMTDGRTLYLKGSITLVR